MNDVQYENRLFKKFEKEWEDHEVINFFVVKCKELKQQNGMQISYIAELEDKIKLLEISLDENDNDKITKLKNKNKHQVEQINGLSEKYNKIKKDYDKLFQTLIHKNQNNSK